MPKRAPSEKWRPVGQSWSTDGVDVTHRAEFWRRVTSNFDLDFLAARPDFSARLDCYQRAPIGLFEIWIGSSYKIGRTDQDVARAEGLAWVAGA